MSVEMEEIRQNLSECRRVAVYGTLRKGFHNHYLLGDSRFIDKGKGHFWGTMYSAGGYPIFSCKEPSVKPIVEIYELPAGEEGELVMENLDMLEGYPHWYDRTIKTFLINSEEITAWIYHQDLELQKEEIDSGDWAEYVKEKYKDE